ncbi:MAG TPA: hypothetical protein VGK67_03325 [Myxococcales bacterium]
MRSLLPVCLLALACSPAPQEPDGGPAQLAADASAARDASTARDASAPAADAAVDSGTPPSGPDASADSGAGPIAADAGVDAGAGPGADSGGAFETVGLELPPGASWCDGGWTPIEAKVCPDGDPACTPSRESQVRWTINGEGFTSIGVMVSPEQGYSTSVVSGPGYLQWLFVMASGTDTMLLSSAAPNVTLMHYAVPVNWGAKTELRFVGTGLRGAGGQSFLYRYEPFDLQAAHAELHAGLEEIAARESAIVGKPVLPFTAFLMPTEIAIPLGYEGNISYGNGVVGINYGNPDWLAAMGGAARLIDWEFSHEYAHEHFVSTAQSFALTPTCLNEGLADAMGNHLGYVPDGDFCPDNDADGTCDWALGCRAVTEYHAKGNCLLWQFKDAGLLTDAFLSGAFNPLRSTYSFDSCDFTSEATGNSYVVYFSEALGAGKDAAAQVTKAGIPNAGSYAAAKAALGW